MAEILSKHAPGHQILSDANTKLSKELDDAIDYHEGFVADLCELLGLDFQVSGVEEIKEEVATLLKRLANLERHNEQLIADLVIAQEKLRGAYPLANVNVDVATRSFKEELDQFARLRQIVYMGLNGPDDVQKYHQMRDDLARRLVASLSVPPGDGTR